MAFRIDFTKHVCTPAGACLRVSRTDSRKAKYGKTPRSENGLLYDLTASLGDSGGEIDVICGYRTPWSNEFLRTRSAHTGVVEHSLHMQAEAIDIRLRGIPTSELRDAALRLHRGGVGYYRSTDFVHVDVGRVRQW